MRNRNVAKRVCACGMALLLGLSCTGCSVAGKLQEFGQSVFQWVGLRDYERLYEEAMDAFLAAVAAGDKEAIRGLFSVNVQKADADLDEQVERLLEAYPGPTEYWDRERGLASSQSIDSGKAVSSANNTVLLISGGLYFWCFMDLTYENDWDPDEIGITSLILYSADYYCALRYEEEGADPPPGPGLDVRTGYPLDCEVRAVGGYPLQYVPGGGPLDEAAVEAFVKQDNGWEAFNERFGEPNAASGLSYYYELPMEDGQPRYLDVSVDYVDNSIFSVSVADDRKWLYEIWDEDNGN